MKYFLLVACCVLSVGCSTDSPLPFDTQQVACRDRSSAKIREEIEHKAKKGSPAWRHFERLVEEVKQQALLGNSEMILFYGMLLRTIVFVKRFEEQHQLQEKIYDYYPEEDKDQMLTALSYIYLAEKANIPNQNGSTPRQKEINKAITQMRSLIESDRDEYKTPVAWIAEAQENARRWWKQCQMAAQK